LKNELKEYENRYQVLLDGMMKKNQIEQQANIKGTQEMIERINKESEHEK